MATRRPLVLVGGRLSELPTGDVLPGANFVPAGGTVGQLAAKASNDDFDLGWVDPPAAPVQEVFAQGAQPADTGSPYLWVQTGLPGGGWSLWFNNDGTT